MAISGGSSGNAPLSEINVTPLVDVMLVLLMIYFIVYMRIYERRETR